MDTVLTDSVFTAYIRSLADSGEPVSLKDFDEILQTLRGPLVHEMKRRLLWNTPPSYLGYIGATSWNDTDLFMELVLDCYQYIFFDRLSALQARLDWVNLDGLIFRNIRNFLHEARRRHDPIGARLYQIAHGAIERLLDGERLHVLVGTEQLRHDTVLGFHPWSAPESAENADLDEIVRRWNDDLLPDLMVAWHRDGVTGRLAEAIAGLPRHGVEAFAFPALMAPFQQDVRARWQAIWTGSSAERGIEESDDRVPKLVPWVRPDNGFESRELFSQLVLCVDERIDKHPSRQKTREHLRRLWLFLRHQAAETAADLPPSMEDSAGLSKSKLGEWLDIPRQRIGDLQSALGEMVQACRGAGPEGSDPEGSDPNGISEAARPDSDPVSVSDPSELVPSFARQKGPSIMSLEARREHLRLKTGERARLPQSSGPSQESGRCPGDVLFLIQEGQSHVGDPSIDWAVLDIDAGAAFLVPVDDLNLVGSGDLALRLKSGEGRVARCDHALRVSLSALEAARRIGELDADSLQRARRHLAKGKTDEADVGFEPRDVDQDAHYRQWIETVIASRKALAAHEVKPLAEVIHLPEPGDPPRVSRRVLEALAASILALLGLFIYLSQQGTIDELRTNGEQLQAESQAQKQELENQKQKVGVLESHQLESEATIAELEQRLADSASPDIGPGARAATKILRSPGERGGRLDPVTLPAEADLLVLLFEVVADQSSPRYRGEVINRATGQTVVTDEHLIPVSEAWVTITLHRSQLRTGDYSIRVDGVDGGQKTHLGTYNLEIVLDP